MNTPLLVAALLTFFVAVGHSVVGERLILGPILRDCELPPAMGSRDFTRRTLRAGWHLMSVFALGMGVILLEQARPDVVHSIHSVRHVSMTLLLSGVVLMVMTRGRHFAAIFFLLAAGFAWMGSV
jgi:hypothetical protein